MQQRINGMKTMVKSADVFVQFKSMFSKLKSENNDLLMNLINSLEKGQQQKLRDILYSQQIQVNNTVVSRKIYKIKPKHK